MKQKIFKSVFITAFISSAVTLCSAFLIVFLFPEIASAASDNYGEIFAYAFLAFAVVAVLGAMAAVISVKKIVRPIESIDPGALDTNGVYEELRPIVSRLYSQNYKVTKQKSELTLRENEFNSITRYMSEGMIVINSRAEILSANPSAREIFGVKKEPKSILLLNNSSGFCEAISSALSGKNGYDSMRKGDKYYSVIATPVSHSGIIEGAVIVIFDITEKEEREALRREFTSNVSHELKTPLTSISGFAELISSGIAEGEDARRFAANIQKESSRLIALVGDVIRLSQLDGGEIPYDEEGVDLFAVAEDVAERLLTVAQRAGIDISVEGESSEVLGNATILEQMVYNLCDNAIKYNSQGGFVKVTVDSFGGEVRLSVADNGIGIPKDKQDRVFERFYRVDKSHSREIGGTGLGLSIVKHAAAYHKARLSLESAEGVGTTVTVEFPPFSVSINKESE